MPHYEFIVSLYIIMVSIISHTYDHVLAVCSRPTFYSCLPQAGFADLYLLMVFTAAVHQVLNLFSSQPLLDLHSCV